MRHVELLTTIHFMRLFIGVKTLSGSLKPLYASIPTLLDASGAGSVLTDLGATGVREPLPYGVPSGPGSVSSCKHEATVTEPRP